MGWIAGLIGLGIFIALNFVKPSSAKGTMKLAIYGTRIITFLIILFIIIGYRNYQDDIGNNFLGQSKEDINQKTFIGEWFISQENKILYLYEDGYLADSSNHLLPKTGTWEYDSEQGYLFLNYKNESEKYFVRGKKGKIITTTAGTGLYFLETDFILTKRDKIDFTPIGNDESLTKSFLLGEWVIKNSNNKKKIILLTDTYLKENEQIKGTWNFDLENSLFTQKINGTLSKKRILAHNKNTIAFDDKSIWRRVTKN